MSVVTQGEARELSPEEQQERAAHCYAIEERIRENISHGRQSMWELAKNLYEFDQENGWTALGYEKQADWLAQPEIGMTRTAYFRLVRKYRELVVRRELPTTQLLELEPSKVDIVMPVIEQDKGKIDAVLEDIKTLGARDLREKYIKTPQAAVPSQKPEGEDDVIEGEAKTITTDAEPIKASEVGTNGSAAEATLPAFAHAAGHVESWLEMGGDRRKAQRNWRKLLREHPAFMALGRLQLLFDGEENAPSREEALPDWVTLRDALGIVPETE